MNSFLSFGDQGDLISCGPLCRALGKVTVYADNNPICKPILQPSRFNAIKPLMEAMEWVKSFEQYAGQELTHNVANWRDGGVPFGETLATLHANWAGVPITLDPWISVPPNPSFKDAIVIARSTRHQNPYFPWIDLIDHFKDVVFIGLPEEHIQLQNETGRKFQYAPTKTLLEVAEILAGAKLFIGNQSSPLNVAIGLGIPFVCECSLTSVDTVYPRIHSWYSPDGSIDKLKVKGFPEFNHQQMIPEREINFLSSPPGGHFIAESADGTLHKDPMAKAAVKMANAYEESMGLPLSTMGSIATQMLARFPRWGPSSYINTVWRQAADVKLLAWQRKQEAMAKV